MASLIANDTSLQQQKQEMVCLKVDNKHLTAKVLTLETEQDKLKSKLNRMEQKGPDHCLVICGIPEWPNEGERKCVDKIYVELSNTIESSEERDWILMAHRMEIKRASKIGCYNSQYSRPLSVEFKYCLDTAYIMKNRGFLSEGVYVDREYTEEIEHKQNTNAKCYFLFTRLPDILRTTRKSANWKKAP